MNEQPARWGPWLPIVVFIVLAGLASGGVVPAEEAEPSGNAERAVVAQEAVASEASARDETKAAVPAPGMTAFLDPETGRLTAAPTPEQRARLQAMIAAEVARRAQGPDIEIIRRPDGSTIARLNGRYEEFAGAFRLPDGSVVLDGQRPPVVAADQ